MSERGRPTPKDEAKKYGGSDKNDWRQYTEQYTVPSCDKGSHKERSLANQPNHIIFWKKHEGKRK